MVAHAATEPCASHALQPTSYVRRRPEKTVLYRVVREHLESLLAECAARSATGRGYPAHVQDEFHRYLDCGVLSRGWTVTY